MAETNLGHVRSRKLGNAKEKIQYENMIHITFLSNLRSSVTIFVKETLMI